jgi:hypothetical protein
LIAKLFHELQHHDGIVADAIPLTVAEARQQILQWLRAKDSMTAAKNGGGS